MMVDCREGGRPTAAVDVSGTPLTGLSRRSGATRTGGVA
jgi:hypothetical protein